MSLRLLGQRMTRDVVAVIGTTGVGKSQYAIDLALGLRRQASSGFNDGVVLSADSMQMYVGLPVITNKVTEEEMQGIEHWGVGIVEPGQGGSWEIVKWIQEAKAKMNTLAKTQLPIICGGTHYYTQHLLYPAENISSDRNEDDPTRPVKWLPPGPLPTLPEDFDPKLKPFLESFYLPEPTFPASVSDTSAPSGSQDQQVDSSKSGLTSSGRPVISASSELLALHGLLNAVDPAEAGRWHWRDGRKVRRGIERWWEAGVRAEAREKGKQVEETPSVSVTNEVKPAKEYRTLIFWVYEDKETLFPRLDARIDKMLTQGLLSEIHTLRTSGSRIYGSESSIDHQEGIFQSIGYKEFSSIPTENLLDADNTNTESSKEFKEGLERMKVSTRQYAKSQLKWIRKQLLPAVEEARRKGEEVWVYVVRGGEVDKVTGEELMRNFLKHKEMPDPSTIGHPSASTLLSPSQSLPNSNQSPTPLLPQIPHRQTLNARRLCPTCSTPSEPISLSIEKEWDAHMKSKGHRRMSRKRDIESGKIDFGKMREEAAERKRRKEEGGVVEDEEDDVDYVDGMQAGDEGGEIGGQVDAEEEDALPEQEAIRRDLP